jgi:NADH:ubiquinone oxidoreductase subunit F (NADH-binding)
MTVAAQPATDVPRLLRAGSGLAAHLDTWGNLPRGGRRLIDEVHQAGLRGRGGAAFPLGVKMRAVARGRRTVVVANGVEREPVSYKDKVLLASAPHLVLDGITLAAESVGATEAFLCIERGASEALSAVARAITERSRLGIDAITVKVAPSPGAYVTGEESALIHWLNDGPAKPTFVPPRPFERGVAGRPTLVSNVETLAHLALIARFGAEWFRDQGTDRDPGTTLVSVNGDVSRPGVYEVAFGSEVSAMLEMARPTSEPQALLIGGYSGTWVHAAEAVALDFDSDSLSRVGAGVGCSAVTVLGTNTCGLGEATRAIHWMATQSAGQCGPCLHGLPALAQAFEELVRGDRGGRASRRLAELSEVIPGRGACHHPDGTVRMALSALRVFGAHAAVHKKSRNCGGRQGVLPVPSGRPVWR